MRRLVLFLMLLLLTSCIQPSMIDKIKKEKRLALVIANQNYPTNALDNPFNDAKAIIKTLRKLDFKVTYVQDTTYQTFHHTLAEFGSQIDENTTSFIYFSGHANTLQSNSNELFFLMVEPNDDVLVSIHKIYEMFRKTNAVNNIIAIDACRNNRYASSTPKGVKYRGVGFQSRKRTGTFDDEPLTQKRKLIIKNNYSYKLPRSLVVSYATHPNEQAHDAGKINPNLSPYAHYLSEHLDDEKGSVIEIFRRVRIKMQREFDDTQSNLEENNLHDNIYLQLPRAMGSPTMPG